MQEVSLKAPVRGARMRESCASMSGSKATSSRSPGGMYGFAEGRDLEKEIVEIERLSLDDLRIRWRNLSGRLAPAHLSRGLLARILAYRIQAQAFGELDRNTARALARWIEPVMRKECDGQASHGEADDPADISLTSGHRTSEPLILKSGTVLTREWQGRLETVMVVGKSFTWNGEVFASLSAVALAMTGTKWNGHRFFGVRPQDRSTRRPEEVDGQRDQPERHAKDRRAGPGTTRRPIPPPNPRFEPRAKGAPR